MWLTSMTLNGTGVLVPQTDPKPLFHGTYAFGIRKSSMECSGLCETDFLGQGIVTDGALTGTGLLNDPGSPWLKTTTVNTLASRTQEQLFQAATKGRYTILDSGRTSQ